MAAATSDLDDIEEKFLQCPICLEQLKEPKQLGCLHRFCSECLSKLLEGSLGVITCPKCREEIAVPEDGVSGFKTDFHLKSIIEFIRFKKLLVKDNETKECCSCSKREQESADCSKCSGLVACHQNHRTSEIAKDSLPSIPDLKDLKIHKLEVPELSQIVHPPRCLKHPDNIMRLCCVTCNYDLICETCAHCDHRDHRKENISTTAKMHKAKLEGNLELLRGSKGSIYKLQDEVKSVSQNTDSYYEKRKISLKDFYKVQGHLIEQIRRNITVNRENAESKIEKRYGNTIAKLDIQMQEEIKQIRDKYKVKVRKTDVKRENLLQQIEAESTHKLSILEQQDKNVTRRFQISEKALQDLREKADVGSVAASKQSENIIERYENLIAAASSILAADNDWTAVQCTPDICSAAETLLDDMSNTLTALGEINQSPSEIPLPVDVTAFSVSYRESIVNVQRTDIFAKSSIDGMVNVPGEGIIIHGQIGDRGGYSQCINVNGEVLWSDISEYYFGMIPQNDTQVYKMKSAVLCFPDAIAKLNKENQRKGRWPWGVQLSEMINHWPTKLSLQCVAADPLKKRIFAGFRDCRDIYVFNDVLNPIFTFSLPQEAKYPFDLAVSVGGLLIICDASGKGVFSTNMKGELQSTYLLPFLDSCGEWIPESVCNDSEDGVFILLSANECRKVVVQYRKHGGHPIAFRRVKSEMSHVVVTLVEQEEKLLLAGSTGNELLVYSTTPYSDEHDEVKEESHEDSPVGPVQQKGVQKQQPEENH